MNEDAFARRFYADRAELDSLGIQLTVDKPLDGVAEQENYSLRPENFHLPPIAFTDEELASLQFALTLLDGEFAYAEPLRLALQQISWGRPSPLHAPDQRTLALGITGSAGGHELSQRLAKVETAIFRHKTITFEYFTMERGDVGARKVDPYHLLFQGGQFYLLGHSHERKALRVFRLSRIRGKVAYATKAEHDFKRPARLRPARVRQPRRVAVRRRGRHRARSTSPTASAGRSSATTAASARSTPADDGGVVFTTAVREHAPARRVGPRARRARARRGPAGARRRGRASASPSSPSATRPAPSSRRPCRRRPRTREERGHRERQRPPRPGRDPPRALRAPRHARLDPHRRRPRRPAPALRGRLRAPADHRPGAARGRQRPERRELRRRLVRALRRGRRRRLGRDRPRAVLRQLRPPGAAAAGRGQGARRGDRPHRRAPARGRARVGAREDRRGARRRPDASRACRSRPSAATTRRRAPRQRGRRRRTAGCGWSTTSPTRTS